MEQTDDELQHQDANIYLPGFHQDLLAGTRKNYLKFGVPLYEASIKGDWRAAKVIFDRKPELVRYAITETGETALHVAASAKRSRHVEKFVKNLVDLMEEEDLALRNKDKNTALYLAAAAGNLQTVKIMMEKNRGLRLIPGSKGLLMPLYVAALYGKYQVVKYLYDNSSELRDKGWTPETRTWLLKKCVAAEMFDVAIKIVENYPKLGRGSILGDLARKPDAFFITKSNIIERSVKSAFALIGLTVGAYEKESEALQLLKIIWEDIAKKPKHKIDKILSGWPDSIKKEEKLTSGKIIQALELQRVIFQHVDNMDAKFQNITSGTPNVTESTSGKVDQSMELQKLINEHLVSMHGETQNIVVKQVSEMGVEAMQLQKLISKHIVNMHVHTQKIIEEESEDENRAKRLKRLIAKNITKMRSSATSLKETSSSRVPFIAAEMGNTKFLVELIRRYPDLSWQVNDNNQTIFHIAVKSRHQGIYNLLYEIGSMKDRITALRDDDDNDILHLVGKSAKKKQLEDVSGAALQMQRELLWFKEVWNMVPPYCRERTNKHGLTPSQLFTEEHKDLITEGEKWMKGTASHCMVVATLIATIVFAASFTVPGGYNQNDGIPVFYRRPTFVVFVVADAISLFLSSTSILTFLSILTSRFAERDFMEALPTKLMLGLVTLFLSITTMMITFGISFFVLYHKEMKWVPILICASAVMPVLLYVVLQYHLLVDVVRSTYGSKFLFKPRKKVLYYVNPRV